MRDATDKIASGPIDPASKKLLESYRDTQSKAHSFITAEKAGIDRKNRNLSNNYFSPRDTGFGIAGMAGGLASHDPKIILSSLLLPIVSKFARERGASMAAVTAEKIAQLVGKDALPSANPTKGSTIYDLGDISLFAIAVDFTGSDLQGTLKLMAGNVATNLVDVVNSSQAITSAASHVWNVQAAGYRFVQVYWTYTSGTGNISAQLIAKGVPSGA